MVDLWLDQAQSTNELDEHLYSHGVFEVEPGRRQAAPGFERVEAVREPPS